VLIVYEYVVPLLPRSFVTNGIYRFRPLNSVKELLHYEKKNT
jgi:hypothetical protein